MIRFETVANRSKLVLKANSSVHPIHTVANKLNGFFEAKFDDKGQVDLSIKPRGQLEVEVESLRSGNALIDRAMKGRINTARYPLIKAEVIQIEKTDTAGVYLAVGNVSFHGSTRRLKDKLTIKRLDERTIKLSGVTEVDTRDFKVEPPRLFMLRVEPTVKVILELVVERVES